MGEGTREGKRLSLAAWSTHSVGRGVSASPAHTPPHWTSSPHPIHTAHAHTPRTQQGGNGWGRAVRRGSGCAGQGAGDGWRAGPGTARPHAAPGARGGAPSCPRCTCCPHAPTCMLAVCTCWHRGFPACMRWLAQAGWAGMGGMDARALRLVLSRHARVRVRVRVCVRPNACRPLSPSACRWCGRRRTQTAEAHGPRHSCATGKCVRGRIG